MYIFAVYFCNDKGDEEEAKAIREKVISTRKLVHSVTEEQVSKRWAFEEAVSNSWFLVGVCDV